MTSFFYVVSYCQLSATLQTISIIVQTYKTIELWFEFLSHFQGYIWLSLVQCEDVMSIYFPGTNNFQRHCSGTVSRGFSLMLNLWMAEQGGSSFFFFSSRNLCTSWLFFHRPVAVSYQTADCFQHIAKDPRNFLVFPYFWYNQTTATTK